ncbi:MAG: hypothetical protein KF708_02980 [Pirellulales bacterium]|nr:hypothetical protein [Pirellulales bacterium]
MSSVFRARWWRGLMLACLNVVGLLTWTVAADGAGVADVDWDSRPILQHRDFQAVDANGLRTFPTTGFPYRLRGILLNNPEDMLDSTPVTGPLPPFNLGAQWQVFVQAVEPGDYGGTAVFMGQHYGNLPQNFEDGQPDPDRSYSNAAWSAEMLRVNQDRATGHVFRAGDYVEIRAQGALAFGGKTNVNEEHFIESELDFELALITPGVGLPTPVPLLLADLWDEINDRVLFDPSRLAGGERYQGELVQLMSVQRIDDGSIWAAGNRVTVADVAGREFSLHLGLNPEFGTMLPPDGFFNAVGIFNQEASGGPMGPSVNGYELWVMDPMQISAVPEPGTFVGATVGLITVTLWIRRRGTKLHTVARQSRCSAA